MESSLSSARIQEHSCESGARAPGRAQEDSEFKNAIFNAPGMEPPSMLVLDALLLSLMPAPTTCTICASGTYSLVEECKQCPPGTSPCISCAAGTYSEAEECKQCPPGTYKAHAGTGVCNDCSLHSSSEIASSSCHCFRLCSPCKCSGPHSNTCLCRRQCRCCLKKIHWSQNACQRCSRCRPSHQQPSKCLRCRRCRCWLKKLDWS